jgi:hypothetical protein
MIIRKPTDSSFYNDPYIVRRGPTLREPNGIIQVYRITTEHIHEFVTSKVGGFVPGARVEIMPEYCEKKKSIPKRSYAALMLALSADTLDRTGQSDPFRRMVDVGNNPKFIKGLETAIIERYRFNREALQNIVNSYKRLDEVDEAFGMTEDYVRSLIKWARPIRQESPKTKDIWIMFAARPEAIITDMLTEVEVWDINTGGIVKRAKLTDDDRYRTLPNGDSMDLFPDRVQNPGGIGGRMNIVDVTQISKENVEFTVHLHVNEVHSTENPELRRLYQSFK